MKHLLSFFICLIMAMEINAQTTETSEFPNSTVNILGGTSSPRHYPNHFTVTPPEGYVLLNETETKTFLVDVCGNPESAADGALGCLVPNVNDVYKDDVPYFFVISDEMCGYVRDNDAADIAYSELLIEMQKDGKEANDEYRKTHPDYPVVRLVGWAEPPYYDKARHTLYWGKLLDFQQETKTINYDMRVLGKEGFVIVQAVGDENDLAELKTTGQRMLGCIAFDKGYTYADFNESKDHVAEWTIGGLVAGKILTKVGFWAIIAKFWKIILLALIGGWAAFKGVILRLFRGSNENSKDNNSKIEETTE